MRFGIAAALVTVAVGAAGLSLNAYFLFVVTKLALYVILCVGLNILVGSAGQLAFAHAAMYGIGAYATGLLEVRLGLPFLPSAAIAIVATTCIGAALTFPALRLSGLYLALSTLSFALAVRWVMVTWDSVTFGPGGFRAPFISLGFGLDHSQSAFLASIAAACVVIVAARNLLRSQYGRCFVAIRESQVAASSAGISVTRVKVLAFAVSAGCAGMAGALFVPVVGFVTPESFGLDQMILFKIMIVVGGLGSIAGSVIGPVVILLLIEVLRDSLGWMEILFGLVLMGFVLFVPGGLTGLFRRARLGAA